MRLVGVSLVALTLALAAAAGPVEASRAAPKPAASGETQVVAKASGREITLSDLRAEMLRLGLSVNNPDAERAALDAIVIRLLLADAARAQNLHRKPDAMLRMSAASEQALADLYLGLAAQPPEPTPEQIEDFVAGNPSLFADRRVYDFAVLVLPTDKFDDEGMAPLFDDTKDFAALVAALDAKKVTYSLSGSVQPSTAFPKPVREQLARYNASDNIVVKGEAQTQIMKIMKARKEVLPSSEWRVLARRLLLEESSTTRAEGLIARLKSAAPIAYYRPSAAPRKAAAPSAKTTPKKAP